jgi:hypothetical protein
MVYSDMESHLQKLKLCLKSAENMALV